MVQIGCEKILPDRVPGKCRQTRNQRKLRVPFQVIQQRGRAFPEPQDPQKGKRIRFPFQAQKNVEQRAVDPCPGGFPGFQKFCELAVAGIFAEGAGWMRLASASGNVEKAGEGFWRAQEQLIFQRKRKIVLAHQRAVFDCFQQNREDVVGGTNPEISSGSGPVSVFPDRRCGGKTLIQPGRMCSCRWVRGSESGGSGRTGRGRGRGFLSRNRAEYRSVSAGSAEKAAPPIRRRVRKRLKPAERIPVFSQVPAGLLTGPAITFSGIEYLRGSAQGWTARSVRSR